MLNILMLLFMETKKQINNIDPVYTVLKGQFKRFSAELWSYLSHLYSGIYGKGLRRCQLLLLSIVFGSELQRGEIIITADEAKGSGWRQCDSSELFNLSDHIVTCSISVRRKSFHLCGRKGERGSISINLQTTPWQAIYCQAGQSS